MPTDKNLIATESADVETEHSTSNEQPQSRHEKNVPPEKWVAEATRVIRELQSSIRTGGQKFTREERNAR